MKPVYHAGELAVQARVGVQYEAGRVGASIRDFMPGAAQDFLRSQPMAILGSVDAHGGVWASLVAGEPGFISVPDETTVRIRANPLPGDPLTENLLATRQIGMLAIELATRRRMRLNGTAEVQPDGITITADEVWGNCPKYIQKRSYQFVPPEVPLSLDYRTGDALSPDQHRWIRTADTFFIATAHPEGGADASHRGGQPGFVQVVDAQTLVFPDYMGNNMFQTLGNIASNPSTGLLFLDFEEGHLLQLTGRARIIWDERLADQVPGALRLVEFRIEKLIELRGANPLRWRFLEYSPFNPS